MVLFLAPFHFLSYPIYPNFIKKRTLSLERFFFINCVRKSEEFKIYFLFPLKTEIFDKSFSRVNFVFTSKSGS